MSNIFKSTYATLRKLGLSAVNAFRIARMGDTSHSRASHADTMARIDVALSNIVHGQPIHAVEADESYTCGRFYR